MAVTNALNPQTCRPPRNNSLFAADVFMLYPLLRLAGQRPVIRWRNRLVVDG